MLNATLPLIASRVISRSVGRRQASVREINPYETPYKPFLPSSAYAIVRVPVLD